MSYTLKTQQIAVKDPETGVYSGVDVLTEQTKSGLLAEIQAEGAAQRTSVTNTGTTQVSAIQTKGAETIASIPSDYTTLSNDVDDLKNTIDRLNKLTGPLVETYSPSFVEDGYYSVNGALNPTSNAQNTGLLPTEGFKSVTFSGTMYSAGWAIAFYDSSKQIISASSKVGNGDGTYTATIPSNAAYVAISNYGTDSKTATLYANESNIPYEIADLKTDRNENSDDISRTLNVELVFRYDGYVATDGNINGTSSAKNTGYLPVRTYQKIKANSSLTSSGYVIAFYNENKTFLSNSSVLGNGTGDYSASIPQTAEYVIVSAYSYPSASGVMFSDDTIESKLDAISKYHTFSVLGDSYSSFAGYMADPSALTWYPASSSGHPDNNVEIVTQTWWYKFANTYGSQLVENASWSGSCISYDSYDDGTDDGKDCSFVQRCKTLKSAELIIIYGGTNDGWVGVAMGDYKYSGFTESDFETFRPSVAFVIDYIQKHNIGSKILFVYNPSVIVGSNVPTSIATICEHYGIASLALPDTLGSNLANSHPNENGMDIIANAVIEKVKTM